MGGKSIFGRGKRELIKGPLYYASTIAPIAIAAICNLCAGDGSIAMVAAGFIVSVGYMHYFSMFGYIEESWQMVLGFLVVSVASALVESHSISTTFDDNLMLEVA